MLDRLKTRTADGATAPFDYGPHGLTQTATNSEGTDAFVFDPAGHLLTHTVTRDPQDGVVGRVHWSYDLADRPLTRSVILGSDSTAVGYHYDARGHLDVLTDATGQTTTLLRKDDGAPDLIHLPNGVDVDYNVGWTGIASLVQFKHGSTVLPFGSQYRVDVQRRLYTRGTSDDAARSPTTGTQIERGFTFDLLGRLTAAADSTVLPCDPYFGTGQDEPTYQGEQPAGYTCPSPAAATTLPYTFSYDAYGNRLGSLGAGNRLTSVTTTGPASAGRGATWSYTYDADGNVLTRSTPGTTGTFGTPATTQTFAWDALGQLDSVVTDVGTVRYGYDALGNRVRRTDAAGTTYTIWAGADVAATLDVHGLATALYTSYPGVDQPHSVRTGGVGGPVRYFAQSAFGNVDGLMDAAGAVVLTYQYGPFGEAEGADTSANRFRFKGRELDPLTGLYDMRARWYDPRAGRFLSEDPIGLAGGLNPYTFAENDPINRSDPTGTEACTSEQRDHEYQEITVNGKAECKAPGNGGSSRPGGGELGTVTVSGGGGTNWGSVFGFGIGFVPVAGDLAGLWEAASGRGFGGEQLSGTDRMFSLAGALVPYVSGSQVRAGTQLVKHHIFPQAFAAEFRGIVDIDQHTMMLTRTVHQSIHGFRGGEWNAAWREFFRTTPNYDAADVYRFGQELIDRFGISGPMTWYR